MQLTGRIATAIALFALAACRAPEPESVPVRPALPERPGQVVDTILVEGMPEPLTWRLLRSPDDAEPPFSTYVPDGISASFEGAGDTVAVRFAAAFTGETDPNAYMHVRLYPPDTPGTVAEELVAGFMRSRRVQDDPVGDAGLDPPYDIAEPPAWGDAAYTFQYTGERQLLYVGRIVIARHGDTIFHVLTHYPAEYGDGLGPRFARILEQWRWDDSGGMLTAAR